MKRLISILLCVVMIISIFSVCVISTNAAQTDTTDTSATYKDNLINAILNEEWYWYDSDIVYSGHYGYTSFYFADLDYDGNLEFIVWEPGGTMGNMSNFVYQYDGELWRASDNESSEVITGFSTNTASLKSYYNKKTGNFKTIGQTTARETWSNYMTHQFKVSYNYGTNHLDVDYYAGTWYKNGTTRYFSGSSAPICWGTVPNNGTTSSTNYNKVIMNATSSSTYANANMSTNLVSLEDWEYYSTSTKRALLSDAYDSFTLKSNLVSTPKLSKLDATPNGVKVSWSAVSGATRYRVYRKSGSYWYSIGDTTSTSLVDTSAYAGNTYTYTVRAVSKNGAYPVSSYSSTGKTMTFLNSPVITRTANAQNGVKIEWAPVSGAEKYRVYVRGGSATSWKKKCDTTSTSYIHETTKSNTNYEYTVRCVTESGKSCRSSYYDPGTFHTFIATPKITKLANTVDGVKITWNAVAGAQCYQVYCKTGSSTSWKSLGYTYNNYGYHTDVKSNTKYTYTVRVVDYNTLDHVSSYNRTGKSIKFYAAPEIYHASIYQNNGIYLKWDSIPGVAKYKVFLWNGSTWKSVGTSTKNSFVYSPVYAGNEYTFTIRCCDSKGNYISGYHTDVDSYYVYNTSYYASTGALDGTTQTETQPQGTAPAKLKLEIK